MQPSFCLRLAIYFTSKYYAWKTIWFSGLPEKISVEIGLTKSHESQKMIDTIVREALINLSWFLNGIHVQIASSRMIVCRVNVCYHTQSFGVIAVIVVFPFGFFFIVIFLDPRNCEWKRYSGLEFIYLSLRIFTSRSPALTANKSILSPLVKFTTKWNCFPSSSTRPFRSLYSQTLFTGKQSLVQHLKSSFCCSTNRPQQIISFFIGL